MRFYLSGGMEYAPGEGRSWREEMQEWLEKELKCSVFNPNVESDRLFSTRYEGVDFRRLKRDDLELYRTIAADLVDLDCKEIAERSDVVICYWDASAQQGAGTKGELTVARYFRKPVFMVTSTPMEALPGWVIGCVTMIYPDFPSLKKALKRSA
jgi:hypothetical protein